MPKTEKDKLCANIINLENEIEMIKENGLSGLRKKQKELKTLHLKLKKMNFAERINTTESVYSPYTW